MKCGSWDRKRNAMFEEVRIRERKSTKHGKTYEYRFEIAPIGGERKWLSKGGFLSEDEAKQAGIALFFRIMFHK